MDVEFSSAKKNQGWMSGLPTESPRALFRNCKNSPVFFGNGPKRSMCWVLEIDEMNGLICVEMDRLMHELRVLARCHNYMEYNCV